MKTEVSAIVSLLQGATRREVGRCLWNPWQFQPCASFPIQAHNTALPPSSSPHLVITQPHLSSHGVIFGITLTPVCRLQCGPITVMPVGLDPCAHDPEHTLALPPSKDSVIPVGPFQLGLFCTGIWPLLSHSKNKAL